VWGGRWQRVSHHAAPASLDAVLPLAAVVVAAGVHHLAAPMPLVVQPVACGKRQAAIAVLALSAGRTARRGSCWSGQERAGVACAAPRAPRACHAVRHGVQSAARARPPTLVVGGPAGIVVERALAVPLALAPLPLVHQRDAGEAQPAVAVPLALHQLALVAGPISGVHLRAQERSPAESQAGGRCRGCCRSRCQPPHLAGRPPHAGPQGSAGRPPTPLPVRRLSVTVPQ
jgi:hypothetical protein